jgi:protein-tyrosine phosphatase
MISINGVKPTYIPFPEDIIGTGKLYRSPMPYANQLDTLKTEFRINRILQLCFDHEFKTYRHEDLFKRYQEKQFQVTCYPIKDYSIPESKEKTRDLVDQIILYLKEGENILIHCVGGNGRTGLLIACLARRILGLNGPDAVQWVRKYVPNAVERPEQTKFVAEFLEDKTLENEKAPISSFIEEHIVVNLPLPTNPTITSTQSPFPLSRRDADLELCMPNPYSKSSNNESEDTDCCRPGCCIIS